ncbi:hypothetical protein KR059_006082 [Drosophila kikkawai]|nr:hypothetical protein KR059_006082 [Drosophila kikkawai]
MAKLYLLLLMAHFVISDRNLNQILDRDDWISIAKEYIRNHKPYKFKNYEPYKPRVVNITNSFGGDLWETTDIPDETINYSTEPPLLPDSTTISGNTEFMETTTSGYESSTASWPTTEASEITTESPETSTLIQTTTASSVYETESTTLESLVDQVIAEPPETTTEVDLSTTETPEISTSTEEESTTIYFTSTEPTPSTVWPWLSTTQPSDITTESIIETTTFESTTSGSLFPETTTSLLDIISTTPGIETTTSYLDTAIDSTEATDFTNETTPPGLNFTTETQEETTTESSKPTTTTRRANLVEDAIRPKKIKYRYTSDTEPEMPEY